MKIYKVWQEIEKIYGEQVIATFYQPGRIKNIIFPIIRHSTNRKDLNHFPSATFFGSILRVLELGYFIGTFGRARVLPFYSEGVELPSDIHRLLYAPADKAILGNLPWFES